MSGRDPDLNRYVMGFAYSIIIPHHNIPSLLERCLKSIPLRPDIQVLVIDDTSDETNLNAFHRLADTYSGKIEFLYTRDGLGAGRARNIALSKARGERVIFADADDYFLPGISDIIEKYKDVDADMVFFNAVARDCETGAPSVRADHLRKMHSVFKKDPEKGLSELRYKFGEPWCKIIRRDLIERYNIRFDEIPIHNDTTFSYLCGFHARTLIVDHTEGYCLTDRTGSVSKAVSDEKLEIRTRVFARKNSFLKKNGIKVFDGIMFGGLSSAVKRHSLAKTIRHLRIMHANGIGLCEMAHGYVLNKKRK